MKITGIKIDKFRTFQNFELSDLDYLHIVTGSNNSGKTNLLGALDLFFNGTIAGRVYERRRDMPSDIIQGGSGKAKTMIEITISFTNDEINNIFQRRSHPEFQKKYLFKSSEEVHLSIRRTYWERETLEIKTLLLSKNNQYVELATNEMYILRTITDRIKYFFLPARFDPEALIKSRLIEEATMLSLDVIGKSGSHRTLVKRTQDTFRAFIKETNKLLDENSIELSKSLQDILKKVPRIAADIPPERWNIQVCLPEEAEIIDAIKNSTVFKIEDGTRGISIESKGSGLQKVIVLIFMAHILKSIKESGRSTKPLVLWGLDEPEVNLQPNLQNTMMSMLTELSKSQQIILVTHSHHFADIYNHEKNISLFDLHSKAKQVRKNKEAIVKTTTTCNASKNPEFKELIMEHLGMSAFDSWVVAPKNYVLEGESDKFYIHSMRRILIGKNLNGSIVSIPPSEMKAHIRHIDNLISREQRQVSVFAILDNDDEGNRTFRDIKAARYRNLNVSPILLASAYPNKSGLKISNEIEDLAIPEIYWGAVSEYLVAEKYIWGSKVPSYKSFLRNRCKQHNLKMTDFLTNWLLPKLKKKNSSNLFKTPGVKTAISMRFSKNIQKLDSQNISKYTQQFPMVVKFLNSL